MANGDVVISEIYANGSSSSLYASDYVVLYNKTGNSIDISNYSLQYALGTSATIWSSVNLSGTIKGSGYYLIRLLTASSGNPLPIEPDETSAFTINLAVNSGRLALTTSQETLSGVDPREGRSDITDLVGYSGGSNAGASEGGQAQSPGTRAIVRKSFGTQDTNDNSNDFVIADPNPKNSSSEVVICYASNTLIKTRYGNVSVERLSIGDLAVTSSGDARPIRWIGHRTVTCQGRKDVMPVRIAAHAFGEGRPTRDLFVSPAHAVCVDVLGEVLIPACRLINGTTITQVDVEEVTYWHVELDSHDILLAEGLPAESYLDCGNRRFFANADATDLLAAPDARPEGALPFCRPFHEAGPLVDLVRARLAARAEELGWRRVEDAFAGLHLVVDGAVMLPEIDGMSANFALPADARDVRLASETSVPAHVLPEATDDRRLGVAVRGLVLDDGLTGAREIALDDPRLDEGFHAPDGGARWTNGAAALPMSLWAGCRGVIRVQVALAGPALPRWVEPSEAIEHAQLRLSA